MSLPPQPIWTAIHPPAVRADAPTMSLKAPTDARFRHALQRLPSLLVTLAGAVLIAELRDDVVGWTIGLGLVVAGIAGLVGATLRAERERHAVAELLTAERRFQQLVEGGPTILYEWEFGDPGRWRYIGPRVSQLLGHDVPEFLADPKLWFQLIHDEDRAAVLAQEERSQELGVGERIEYRMRHRDGRVVWVADEAIAVMDEGDPAFFRGIVSDITAQKLAEKEIEALNEVLERRVEERTAELHRANVELQAAKEDIERASRVQSEFLSRASHELRTPLNAILGFSQLLETSPLDPGDQDAVRHIAEGGRRLLELVTDVLDISTVRAGRLSLSIEPVSIQDVMNEVVTSVDGAAAERSIQLRVTTGGAPTFVLADRHRLRQALLGIATHAIRFSREGTTVSFTWASRSDRVRVEITDTGPGIDPGQIERLFATFDAPAGSTVPQGAQLGLPLAKALVEAMGGSIALAPRQGAEGSTVSVELRAAEDPSDRLASGPAAGDRVPVDRTSATILYIEDNPANLDLVATILERRPGTTLLRATRGEVGLRLASDQLPDLILLDLHLPDMNGKEILSRLRAETRTASIGVIVMSSEQRTEPSPELTALGISGFLPKPIDVNGFLEHVDRTLAEGGDQDRGLEARRRQDSNL